MYIDIILYVIFAIIGFIAGVLIEKAVLKTDGLLIIDDEDDETTQWILDVRFDPEELENRKEIHLKVCKKDQGV